MSASASTPTPDAPEDPEGVFFFEGEPSSTAPPDPRGDLQLAVRPTLNVHPLSSYQFGTKERQVERDSSTAARMARYERLYKADGPRASVDGVLLGICERQVRWRNLEAASCNRPRNVLELRRYPLNSH